MSWIYNGWWMTDDGRVDRWTDGRTQSYPDLHGRPPCSSCIPTAAEGFGTDLWLSASHGSWTATVWETITSSLCLKIQTRNFLRTLGWSCANTWFCLCSKLLVLLDSPDQTSYFNRLSPAVKSILVLERLRIHHLLQTGAITLWINCL